MYITIYLYYGMLHRLKKTEVTIAVQQHREILKYDVQQKNPDTKKYILYNYILYNWYNFVKVHRKASHC